MIQEQLGQMCRPDLVQEQLGQMRKPKAVGRQLTHGHPPGAVQKQLEEWPASCHAVQSMLQHVRPQLGKTMTSRCSPDLYRVTGRYQSPDLRSVMF